jgi:hypothetical protein
MSITSTVLQKITSGGKTYNVTKTVESENSNSFSVTLPAAKTGQLTTRTDNDTGTLTMSSGHGITTGARLDLYWDGGCRRGITVGTVATNSVPIDGGSGDNLPTNLTNITAQVPQEESQALTGNDVTLIALGSDSRGVTQIVVAQSGGTEIAPFQIAAGDGGAMWMTGQGTNPLSGGSVGKVFLSHGSSAASAVVSGTFLRN